MWGGREWGFMPFCESFFISSSSLFSTSNQSPSPRFLLTVSSLSFTLQSTFLWPSPLPLPTEAICFQVHLPHNHQGILAWLLCLFWLDFLILLKYSICTRFNEVLVPNENTEISTFIPLFLWTSHPFSSSSGNPLTILQASPRRSSSYCLPLFLLRLPPFKPMKQISHKVAA